MAPTKSSSRGSGVLYVGRRVRVCDQPQICGEVVRVIPITGRIIGGSIPFTQSGAAPFAAFDRNGWLLFAIDYPRLIPGPSSLG
jgi:hypothetical protein